MRLGLALIIVIMLAASALAAVTQQEAGQTAAQYKDSTENINIQPAVKTRSGTSEYWIFEIISFGKTITLIPVNAETGSVESENTIVPAMKAHYLANFFATHTEINGFLRNTLDMVISIQSDFEQRESDYINTWEPSIPENITFAKSADYKQALRASINQAEGLRTKIVNLQSIIQSVTTPEDIALAQSGFDAFFTSEEALIASLNGAVAASDAFTGEISQKVASGELDRSFGTTLSATVSLSSLRTNINKLETQLQQNKNTITAFFNGLDDEVEQLWLQLGDRVSDSANEQLRQQVGENLTNYTASISNIILQRAQIPPTFDADIAVLESLLNDTVDLYADGKYSEAKAKFTELEQKIAALEAQIGNWPPTCTGGKVFNNQECVCPTGTEEQADGTCKSPEAGGLNWTLILLLAGVLVIVLLFKKFKPKIGNAQAQQAPTGTYIDMYNR